MISTYEFDRRTLGNYRLFFGNAPRRRMTGLIAEDPANPLRDSVLINRAQITINSSGLARILCTCRTETHSAEIYYAALD